MKSFQMQKMVLKDIWLIGHEQIDREHNELTGLINEMVDCFDAKDATSFRRVLASFCNALEIHFKNETEIMNSLGYVQKDHANTHSDIFNRIKVIEAEANEENMQYCLSNIIDIFVNKVLKDDIYFSEYLVRINYENT